MRYFRWSPFRSLLSPLPLLRVSPPSPFLPLASLRGLNAGMRFTRATNVIPKVSARSLYYNIRVPWNKSEIPAGDDFMHRRKRENKFFREVRRVLKSRIEIYRFILMKKKFRLWYQFHRKINLPKDDRPRMALIGPLNLTFRAELIFLILFESNFAAWFLKNNNTRLGIFSSAASTSCTEAICI